MLSFLGFLLLAWLLLVVIGFAFHALLWLAFVGLILFVGTSAFGIGQLRKR